MKLVDADLAAPRAPVVFSGDSSTYGYSLALTRASSVDIFDADRFHERWRFKTEELSLADDLGASDRIAPYAPHAASAFGSLGLDIAGIAEQAGTDRPVASRRRRAPARVVDVGDRFRALDDVWTDPRRWRNIVKGG